jgi:hypothetical protein
MKEFKVKYEINVQAQDFKDAALQVEDILLNMEFRPCFEITESNTGKVEKIDLEELEVYCNYCGHRIYDIHYWNGLHFCSDDCLHACKSIQ